jgi:hypothetical protein
MTSPPPTIVVLIQTDPSSTHRAAEGIRIALGLSTGPNPLTIILLGKALILLTDEAFDSTEGEILEKHLPVIQELEIPILIPEGSQSTLSLDTNFAIQENSLQELGKILASVDRTLVF